MADIGGSANDAFGMGVNHLVNPGRGNDNSITLGGNSARQDPGLAADDERWAELTPHAVLTKAQPSIEDAGYQQFMRQQGNYQPGSFGKMTDMISDGADPEG